MIFLFRLLNPPTSHCLDTAPTKPKQTHGARCRTRGWLLLAVAGRLFLFFTPANILQLGVAVAFYLCVGTLCEHIWTPRRGRSLLKLRVPFQELHSIMRRSQWEESTVTQTRVKVLIRESAFQQLGAAFWNCFQ